MVGRDLRAHAPRRWSESIDGIVWLPRLIDKARAWRGGTLGTYLYGQSPIDDEFFDVAGLDYARFTAIVDASPKDEAVVEAICAASPYVRETLRSWSRALPKKRRLHLAVLDIDDGYDVPAWAVQLRGPANAVFAPVAWLLRRAIPVRT